MSFFPGGSEVKASAYNVGDLSSIPGSGRSPGEGNGNPLQYLPGESHEQRSLVGYSPRGHKESDTTEWLHFTFTSDVFLELSCFFNDPANVGNLIPGSSALSKSSLNIWKFTVHILLKPGLKNFEHYFASMWDECNCVVVWTFFGIAFLWDWNKNWPFPVLWPLLSFPNLLAYWVQHFHSIIFDN